jgi:hypothetical protein
VTDRPPPSPANVLRLILLGLAVLYFEWNVLVFIALGQVNHEYERRGILDGGGHPGDMQAATRGTGWWLLLLLAQILLILAVVRIRQRRPTRIQPGGDPPPRRRHGSPTSLLNVNHQPTSERRASSDSRHVGIPLSYST